MMRNPLRLGIRWAAIGLALIVASNASAQNGQEVLGRFGDWTAIAIGNGDDRFCYMISQPQDASLRSDRGTITYMIWHQPAAREWDVVQVDIGYVFKQDSDVEVKIGTQAWSLFTREGNAWANDQDDDTAIVRAMRAGRTMTIKGTSSRNNPTADSYSLIGVTKAHGAINVACGR